MGKNKNEIKKSPASAIQKQFWLISQLHPHNTAYHIAESYDVHGKLNLSTLEKCINTIIRRHEIFRTYFTFENGNLFQNIVDDLNLPLTVHDLSSEGNTNSEEVISQILRHEIDRPFELERCPLMRVTIVQRNSEQFLIILVMHHIITDLETKQLFADELSQIYAYTISGEAMLLQRPNNQYSDYADWQQKWLLSDECEKMIRYWEEQLKGTSGLLQLPTDRNRPSVQSLNGSIHPIRFTRQFTEELKKLSRQQGMNSYLLLLAAYITILHRYSGQSDIVVGVPLTNRRKYEHKKTMGCFVNIVPLTVMCSGSERFIELMRLVRKQMLGAHRNQEVPFESLLERIRPERNASYNPIFQVGFTFGPPMPLDLQGLIIEPVYQHHGGSQLDLFATFWESNQRLEGVFEFNTDLFDNWKIASFVENFETLLKNILSAPDQPVATIPLIANAEKEKLLTTWNFTEMEYPESACLHHLFEEQVDCCPDAVAVRFENQELSYQTLEQRSNQLAAFLKFHGVKPDVLVGVCMERSTDLFVVLLGILKAGGAYVPIDPDFPVERIAYMVDHSEVPVILTQQSLMETIPESQAKLISIDGEWIEISQYSSQRTKSSVRPEHLAYVMYTSGSTGKPKGVQIPHCAVVNFLISMAKVPGLNSSDILTAVTTLSFDISVLELFLPLAVGAKVEIVSRIVATDGALLRKTIEATGATFMQATPTTWRLLLAAGWKPTGPFKVLCGGEALPADLARELIETTGSVWNMYGPTETTIWSTCYHMTDVGQQILIGKPIANTIIYILDQNLNPVPLGVQGELFIGGDGVARGYLKRPNLTAERFLQDPFCDDSNARIYRTGDYCRYLEDGNIEFYNRIDNQVKIHGFRIELGEIESMLNKHPQVREAAATVHEDQKGNKRIVGYVVPKNEILSIEVLREFLQEKLPYYMIPGLFMTIQKMPLTPNAKIDRKALPKPDTTRPELEVTYVAPSNPSEEKMAQIWCDVLGIDRVGVRDSFFALGGNSLLSIQIIASIQKAFNIDLRVSKLFQFPTVSALVSFIGKEEEISNISAAVHDRARLRTRAYSKKKPL